MNELFEKALGIIHEVKGLYPWIKYDIREGYILDISSDIKKFELVYKEAIDKSEILNWIETLFNKDIIVNNIQICFQKKINTTKSITELFIFVIFIDSLHAKYSY